MAYAIRNPDGTASAVGFEKTMLHAGADQDLVEIDDAIATEVLEARRSLRYVFEPPPIVEPTIHAQPRRHRDYTHRYPAMMPDRDVDALSRVAQMIPNDATCVEIGSRLGGSARIIMDTAPWIKRLYCIDIEWKETSSPCLTDGTMRNICETWSLHSWTSCYAFAQQYLQPFANVRLLPRSSPYELSWWTETVDFVFEDCSHANPQLDDNIDFWLRHLKSGGIFAGHDYHRNWPDVIDSVKRISARLGVDPVVDGTIWWFRKP